MARRDFTDVTMVVDRSGSMAAIQADAEGGVNAFIQAQIAELGECVFTLLQFDNEWDYVYKGQWLGKEDEYKLVPRGATALLDAVGRAIVDTGERIKAMAEGSRPGLVVFVIVTDGHENCSIEYTQEAVKKMIETQQSEFSWQFTFLCTTKEAFAEARGMGIAAQSIGQYDGSQVGATFSAAVSNVSRMRGQTMTSQSVSNHYTDQEREDMKESSSASDGS